MIKIPHNIHTIPPFAFAEQDRAVLAVEGYTVDLLALVPPAPDGLEPERKEAAPVKLDEEVLGNGLEMPSNVMRYPGLDRGLKHHLPLTALDPLNGQDRDNQ